LRAGRKNLLRWRIESAFNRLKDFRRHCHAIRQASTKLLGFCLPRRSSRDVQIVSLGVVYLAAGAIRRRGRRQVSLRIGQVDGGIIAHRRDGFQRPLSLQN